MYVLIYLFFNLISRYVLSNDRASDWEGMWREVVVACMRYYPIIYLNALSTAVRNVSQNSWPRPTCEPGVCI
jgi:hypothetical protein